MDSLIELASTSTIIWLYTSSRGGSDGAEGRAQLIAVCFAVIALAGGSHSNASWSGVAVAAPGELRSTVDPHPDPPRS